MQQNGSCYSPVLQGESYVTNRSAARSLCAEKRVVMERRFLADNERHVDDVERLVNKPAVPAEPYPDQLAGRAAGNSNAAALAIPLPRPSWLPVSVWPFETLSVDTAEGEVAFTDVGQGPVLLFVHTGFWSF